MEPLPMIFLSCASLAVIGFLLLICVLGALLWLLTRLPYNDMGDVIPLDYSDTFAPQPWNKAFAPTGAPGLEFAVRLKGDVYRWQKRQYLFVGNDFPRMFDDGPWRWDARGRFAGRGVNCGHYFGLSEEAATNEARHYGMLDQPAVLLRLTGESHRILDLTHPDVIRLVVERCVVDAHLVSWSYFEMLAELVERCDGGSGVTDYIGRWALQQGYDGILFFSARVLDEHAIRGYNKNLEGLEYRQTFYEMRRDVRCLNVVFFSGARVVSLAETYQVNDLPAVSNDFYGVDTERILDVQQHGSEYQETRARFQMTKPQYFKVE